MLKSKYHENFILLISFSDNQFLKVWIMQKDLKYRMLENGPIPEAPCSMMKILESTDGM